MLVMLVTLIVSLPLMTDVVRIDMPHGPQPPDSPQPQIADLDVDADGTMAWNGAVLKGLPQLESVLRSAAAQDPQPEVHLHADRRARYGRVAQVLATVQRNRIQRIGFADTADFGD